MPDRDRPWDRRRDDDDRDEREERRDEVDPDEMPERRPRRRRREYDGERSPQSNGLAIVGLILGISSFCFSCLTGVPAVICSAIAMSRPGGRGPAVIGLVCGIIGTILTVPFTIMLIPAVQKVRESAGRMQEGNNLKQMVLAAENDNIAKGKGFYAPYAHDGDKLCKGLSFRVSLLPYMEEQNVYNRFDLKQDWNSAKNQPASDMVVKTYLSPFDLDSTSMNRTHYRAFVGGGAMFNEDGKPVKVEDIEDGTANTLMYIHAAEQVPWAQPKELNYSANSPLPALGSPNASIIPAVMADGSVRFIKKDVSEFVLRCIITRSDGRVLPSDWDK